MSGPLLPKKFERRFQDLMEIGRARLRSLAPDWTDHNAHDPGITLMELLAWNAEAQLYSLSRIRRDERQAFAALFGVSPAGARPAQGIIWPDRNDSNSPATTFVRNVVIPFDTRISIQGLETPTFRPTSRLFFVPGRIKALTSRQANGQIVDHTRSNARGGVPYFPFGENAGRQDVLTMTFECRDDDGLIGTTPQLARSAYWTIGVLAALSQKSEPQNAAALPESVRPPLTATIIFDEKRIPVRIAADSSFGLLKSGSIMLDLKELTERTDLSMPLKEFTLELRSVAGFPRPPRVLRIEPNVVPIQEGKSIERELHIANGMPEWSFQLNETGLQFAMGEEPLLVEVIEASGQNPWTRRERLIDSGPNDQVFTFDPDVGEVNFGNGVNGRIPPAESHVMVSYSVTAGESGCIARNRKWTVTGIQGIYGVNFEPVGGGEAATGPAEQRRLARTRSREDHPLVAGDDIVLAALALPLLEVARAWIPSPHLRAPRTGTVTLVAMRYRPDGIEPEDAPETIRWLDAIRRSLLAKIPLGTRLNVVAPRYKSFSLRAVVEVETGRDPASIRDAVWKRLGDKLALTDRIDGQPPRQPGVSLSIRDLTVWIRAVEGVKRVVDAKLLDGDGRILNGDLPNQVAVSGDGLPRWIIRHSHIEIQRRLQGGRDDY